MSRNILIVQNFNPNKGNNSVVSAMMYALKDDDVLIEVTSVVPQDAIRQYGVNCYDWLVSYKDVLYSNTITKKTLALIKEMIWVLYLFVWIMFYKIHLQLWIPKRKKETVDAYMRADVVVFPGGHSFTTMNGLGQVFSHCVGFYFGKIVGKKTMVYAHTIGPFDGRFSKLIRRMSMYVLERTDIVTIREEDSMKYCSNCNVKITAETVFCTPTDKTLAKDVEELQVLRSHRRRVVGLTIHHIYYKYFYSKEEYIKKMVDVIDSMIDSCDCEVLLIPMEANTGNYNDRDLAKEIKTLLHTQERFSIIEKDYEPAVTCSIISNCDIFVGTKTHSIVYGLKSEVPTLCISYQQKSNEFMEMYGVLENAINLQDLNLQNFEKIFGRILNNLEAIRKSLHIYNSIVVKRSLQNRDILLKLIENEQV